MTIGFEGATNGFTGIASRAMDYLRALRVSVAFLAVIREQIAMSDTLLQRE